MLVEQWGAAKPGPQERISPVLLRRDNFSPSHVGIEICELALLRITLKQLRAPDEEVNSTTQ
jgi:hypothetical protein